MIFIAYMVVDISVLEEKASIVNFACSDMESIIASGIFLYGTECTVDLVLSLIVLMICSGVVSFLRMAIDMIISY